MATYISEAQLRAFERPANLIKASNTQMMTKARATRANGVFLSHSHEDKDLVLSAVQFLKSQGVDVFVDWLDESMPDNISGETAEKLKQKIKEYAKFLVLVTENSKNSKWVPWELGVADGNKPIQNIAVLPVDRTGKRFQGNEYLDIYPKIEFYNDKWLVWLLKPQVFKYLPEWLRMVID
jgi:hypothetical protein